MTTVLRSYVYGEFVEGSSSVLVNPATEAVVAHAGTEKVDFEKAVRYARDRREHLQNMTFAARGEILRAMSRVIHTHRDALIALAVENGGNTRSDAKFDIDGASGTLAAYADLGKELGDKRVLLDGDKIQLGRSARLYGQHLYTTRQGLAFHINAFNFPAWGLAEKAATALLAGMPVVTKPGTSTALVAARMVELFMSEKILPTGALTFLAGGAGDLLSHLRGQDVLAFTGGSSTGRTLRGDKNVVFHSVRVNVEADSLNAAVLGPSVETGSDLMNLFLADVVRDMTQKTGQKCTAIRRVYVPRERVDEIVALVSERLAGVRVGDPSREEVTMGPVATAAQLRDVKEGIQKLAAVGKIVFGAGDLKPLGVPPGKGFFVPPTLILHHDPREGDPVHEHEVFGPVATIMPYDGTAADAARLVAAGGGGLVSSVYADDKGFLESALLSFAPHHGRVTFATSKSATQSLPPGMVLPQLVHGGPGRAGAGEELGGARGLEFYMQRTALQGDRAVLDAMFA